MQSSFTKDLDDEQVLGMYMDTIYPTVFSSSSYQLTRVVDLDSQHKGIDLKLFNDHKSYAVDEKARLHSLNKSFPTFAFEISYLKGGDWRLGWLFDESKETDIYFLITNIYTVKDTLASGISKVSLIGVYRSRLLSLLAAKGLSKSRILSLSQSLRSSPIVGRSPLTELSHQSEGYIYFSKKHIAEQPINLVLKLDFLLAAGVAKRLPT